MLLSINVAASVLGRDKDKARESLVAVNKQQMADGISAGYSSKDISPFRNLNIE